MERDHRQWTDEEILMALRDPFRSADGIRMLYKGYLGSLTAYVVSNSGSEDDAQDIFQEVVVAFVHQVKAGKFRQESSIKTFLYAMNRNLWLNELKRRDRAGVREKKFEETRWLSGREETATFMERKESAQKLMQVMERLGEGCKKVLLLFYFENRAMKEILDETAYENEQVVRNKKYKCLKKLEELIRKQESLYQQLKTFLNG